MKMPGNGYIPPVWNDSISGNLIVCESVLREDSERKITTFIVEMGGHPTARAFTLLGPSRRIQPSLDWLEFANHLASIWNYAIPATPALFVPLMDRKPGPAGPSSAVSRYLVSDSVLCTLRTEEYVTGWTSRCRRLLEGLFPLCPPPCLRPARSLRS